MVKLTIFRIRGTAPSEMIKFKTAREARSYLLQIKKQEQANIEGTGRAGKLVAGKGSGKRLVATFKIEEVSNVL